jgi:hypothetical protein
MTIFLNDPDPDLDLVPSDPNPRHVHNLGSRRLSSDSTKLN